MPELELQVGHDRDQVGVAAALAVAVDRPLHVGGARGHAGQRVGHAAAGVVVAVDAHAHLVADRGHDRVHRRPEAVGQRSAVGVAGHDGLGAGLERRAQAAHRVVGVVGVAVEEVLGVVDHALALPDEEGDGLGDHAQVLVAVDAHDLVEVQPPGLAHQRAHGRERVREHAQRRVGVRGHVAAPGHPEGGDVGVAEGLAPEQLKQLLLLGVGGREAGFDQVDAERVEPVRDAQLLVGRERHALALHAIPKRRVVELDVQARTIRPRRLGRASAPGPARSRSTSRSAPSARAGRPGTPAGSRP